MTDLSQLSSDATSYNTVREGLKKAGYKGKELDEQLATFQQDHQQTNHQYYRRLNRLFGLKEFLDRLAYGFGATQFVTLFFFLTGASAFLVGIINGLKDLLGGLISSFLHQYAHVQTLGKNFIANSGILFGFSFLGLVFAIRTHSAPLFAVFVLLGSIGVVAYGELHMRLFEKSIPHEKKSGFLKKLTRNGLLITALAFVGSAYLIDRFSKDVLMIGTFSLPLSGYFLIFEAAAIAFILSGFILSKIPDSTETVTYPFWKFLKEYRHHLREQRKLFFSNKHIKLLYFANMLTTIIQSLGASFYGYYIYKLFEHQLFGGFLNVAIIFGIAILVSFLGPSFTRMVQKSAGLAPLFVFGTLLIAIMPLTLVYNTHFPAIAVASSAMVIGASTLGVAQGLLTRKLLFAEERKVFFQSQSVMLIIPFLIFIPAGAYVASNYSFELLFKILLYVLVGLVTPLYLFLVIQSRKKRL
ncbi:MAG: hypothetical protein KC535_00410 [Nanoarchaeota archaeon]|nr:hypothetical protein [Nanoarchaeota archaeon]